MDHLTDIQAMEAADGRTISALRRDLVAHLEVCETCRRSVDEVRTLRTTLRGVHPPQLSRSFAERVAEAAMGEGLSDEQWMGPERIAARTVLVLAIVVALFLAITAPIGESFPESPERLVAGDSGDSTSFLLATTLSLSRDDILLAAIGKQGQQEP